MSFTRRTGSGTTNSVFRKVTSSTAFGGGGANMLSLTSSVNSGTTTAASGGNIGTNPSGGGSAGGGGGTGTGTGNGGCPEIEALMSSTIVTDISEISKNYASGAFEIIKSQLNQTLYNNYSLGLYNARIPSNSTYEKVRKFINSNLEGLLQSINLYNTNTSVTAQRDAYKLIADRFNDPNELLAQLNMLQRSMSLFPDQHITVIPVEIKPEYLAYIKTYGYPENGIWDPDLLGAILASIGPASNV